MKKNKMQKRNLFVIGIIGILVIALIIIDSGNNIITGRVVGGINDIGSGNKPNPGHSIEEIEGLRGLLNQNGGINSEGDLNIRGDLNILDENGNVVVKIGKDGALVLGGNSKIKGSSVDIVYTADLYPYIGYWTTHADKPRYCSGNEFVGIISLKEDNKAAIYCNQPEELGNYENCYWDYPWTSCSWDDEWCVPQQMTAQGTADYHQCEKDFIVTGIDEQGASQNAIQCCLLTTYERAQVMVDYNSCFDVVHQDGHTFLDGTVVQWNEQTDSGSTACPQRTVIVGVDEEGKNNIKLKCCELMKKIEIVN